MGPQGGQGSDPTSQLTSTLIMFGGIIFIFYFMMIRPQQKKQKELKRMLDDLQKGDKVVTNSGIHGSVAELDDEGKTVTLNVSDNTKIKFDRASVALVIKKNS
jgi:preprotein translocase subunit YajC